MPRRIIADVDENESVWDLPGELIVIGVVILVLACSSFWGWASELSVFDNKVDSEVSTVQIPVEFVLNYQTTPQVTYETVVVEGELTHKTEVSWTGEVVREECVVSAQVNSEKVNNLVGTANAILSAAQLPLNFQQRGVGYSMPVDCATKDFSHKVYIEITGAEGSGELLYIREIGFDHEEAWVTLPRNLYDLVLIAAVNRTQFVMPNYATAGWYRGLSLASVTYEVGDPNGLYNWTQSWLPTLQYVYGTNLAATTPVTAEVEVVVGSKKVKVGEHRECTNRYKGNCRNFEMIPDYNYVPITELRQINSVNYFMP